MTTKTLTYIENRIKKGCGEDTFLKSMTERAICGEEVYEFGKEEIEFLKESNAIEREYSEQALEDSRDAWEYAKNKKKISITQILDIHRRLMKNINPIIAGKIRNVPVYVGNRECLEFWNINKTLKYLITIKPSTEEGIRDWHIEFEKCHPFIDGNGRTGRILMNFQRLKIGLPILIIHEGKEQQEYYKWFKVKELKEESE